MSDLLVGKSAHQVPANTCADSDTGDYRTSPSRQFPCKSGESRLSVRVRPVRRYVECSTSLDALRGYVRYFALVATIRATRSSRAAL